MIFKINVYYETLFPKYPQLVGGFNPSEKYARQTGSFHQIGMKIKNIWVATTQSIYYKNTYGAMAKKIPRDSSNKTHSL